MCLDEEESAQIGLPRVVRMLKAHPLGPKCGSRFSDADCSAIIGAEFGSYPGNVGLVGSDTVICEDVGSLESARHLFVG